MNTQTDILEERKERTKKLVQSIQNLPSFPVVIMEVSRMLDNPSTSAAKLGKVISKDQALVAKILRIANSPLFGLPRKVSTIEFAIVILGYNHIKNIVIALAALESFNSQNSQNWNRNKFWAHSVIVASVAKKIAEDLGYRKSGEAFIGGLLHDLGISIIQRFLNKDFNDIVALVESGHFSYLEAEEEVLKLTHSDIGQYLASNWNLPKSLGEVILFHHTPSLGKNYKELCAIIHLADYMTQHFGVGEFDWDEGISLDENIIDILQLGSKEYLEEFVASYENTIELQKANIIL